MGNAADRSPMESQATLAHEDYRGVVAQLVGRPDGPTAISAVPGRDLPVEVALFRTVLVLLSGDLRTLSTSLEVNWINRCRRLRSG
jgi:hypothetical protein